MSSQTSYTCDVCHDPIPEHVIQVFGFKGGGSREICTACWNTVGAADGRSLLDRETVAAADARVQRLEVQASERAAEIARLQSEVTSAQQTNKIIRDAYDQKIAALNQRVYVAEIALRKLPGWLRRLVTR